MFQALRCCRRPWGDRGQSGGWRGVKAAAAKVLLSSAVAGTVLSAGNLMEQHVHGGLSPELL